MRAAFLALLLFAPYLATADVVVETPDFATSIFRAEVVSIESSGRKAITATRMEVDFQQVTARIIEGPREGQIVSAENSSTILLKPGDVFYLHRIDGGETGDLWSVGEPDRRWVLLALALVFVIVTVLVGAGAGVRALIALVGSLALILFGLVPLLLSGAPPVITCTALAFVMLAFSMIVTHGVNRPTLVALLGGVVALLLSAVIAETAVTLAMLSGFVGDEVVFLNFAADGKLNLSGLLLGGILIGVVGVLNDISVSQVHTVVELHEANKTLTRSEILTRAMRVGREHFGAVINTLPLAYAGSALPLLMLFSTSASPFLHIANREVFAAELIRILAGGIALALSGAIATVLAVFLLIPKQKGKMSHS
jgi:uncharacterized membrane protein